MKTVSRLAVLGLGLYLLLTTGLLEGLVYLVISAGSFIIQLASEQPLAAAIGLLFVLAYAGSSSDAKSN